MARRGRRELAVIGYRNNGEVRRWRSIRQAALDLGTTRGTLYVYICQDKEYKGYSFDYAPSNQLTLF